MSESSVPPHPVVDIVVSGDGSVLVDGQPVDPAGDPHAAAVHAAADRVAAPLGRPVRAIATDPQGRTELIVHPDGGVSDVRALDAEAAPAEEEPDTGFLTGMLDDPVSGEAGRPVPAADPSRGGGREGSGPGWLVGAAAAGVCLLLVVVASVYMLMPDRGEESGETAVDPGEAERSQATSRGEPTKPEILLVTASALGDGLLKFLVAAPGAGEVEIRVTPAKGRPKGQIITLGGTDIGETLFAGLAGGSASWTVERPGAPVMEGRTTVLPEPGRDKGRNKGLAKDGGRGSDRR